MSSEVARSDEASARFHVRGGYGQGATSEDPTTTKNHHYYLDSNNDWIENQEEEESEEDQPQIEEEASLPAGARFFFSTAGVLVNPMPTQERGETSGESPQETFSSTKPEEDVQEDAHSIKNLLDYQNHATNRLDSGYVGILADAEDSSPPSLYNMSAKNQDRQLVATFGTGSCNYTNACEGSGTAGDYSCNGQRACTSLQVIIGNSSCNSNLACYYVA